LLLSGNVLLTFLMSTVMPASASIAAHFAGATDAALEAQIVLTAPAAALIVGSPIAGILIGRWGRRVPFLLALGLYAVSGGAPLVLEGFWPLVVSRVLVGLAGGAVSTISMTLIGDYYVEPARTRIVAWAGVAPAAGSMVALLLGGILVDWGGWHMPFIMYLLAVPVLVLALGAIQEPARSAAHTAQEGALPRGFQWTYLVATGFALVSVLPAVQLPFLLVGDGVTSARIVSLLITCNAVTAILIASLYPRLRRSFSADTVLALMLAETALCDLLLANETGLLVVATAFGVLGLSVGLMIPHFVAVAIERASATARARAVGLTMSAVFLGQFLILSRPSRSGRRSARTGCSGRSAWCWSWRRWRPRYRPEAGGRRLRDRKSKTGPTLTPHRNGCIPIPAVAVSVPSPSLAARDVNHLCPINHATGGHFRLYRRRRRLGRVAAGGAASRGRQAHGLRS
jgi:MFS family permease